MTVEKAEDGTLQFQRGGGGLVTALSGLCRHTEDATWIACARTDADADWEEGRVPLEDGSSIRVRFLSPDPAAYADYYNVIANPLLWFLQHSMWDVPRAPVIDRRTWQAWEDNHCYDPPCLQSLWCRILEHEGSPRLSMNVRFRSNDAYKAAFMNIFALVQWQCRIAARVSEMIEREVRPGRYCHLADSYHIYGSNMQEFETRFLGALQTRSFERRTMRYADVRQIMEEARPAILEKARQMGRT